MITSADFANLSLLQVHAPLRRLLEAAQVVPSDYMPRDVVTMNTHVVVHDETTGERRALRLVFPDDANPAAGLVSGLDPLGLQLLGKSPSDVFKCPLADGEHRLRVERVVYQPEYSLRTNLVVRG
jgi:regulator of nucleoside diphosphate kinase